MSTNYIPSNVREELTEMIIETLENGYDGYVADLHNEVFNMDYFIIGTYDAKEWMKKNYDAWEAIDKILEYEKEQFGEVYTDVSDPEKVVNMLVYILGEEIMYELDSISGDNWNSQMTEEIRQEILAELKDEEEE